MKHILVPLVFFPIAAVLTAQGPAASPMASMKTFTSSAEVTALIAKAKGERKDGQAIVIEPILQFAPYSANLEYRASAGAAAVHPKDAEMIYVIEGSATFVSGGKLTGATIQGGETRAVSKGGLSRGAGRYAALVQRGRRSGGVDDDQNAAWWRGRAVMNRMRTGESPPLRG